jgi:tRNA-specific 2-thiouridylase
VEPFVRGYERGETPNPCIRCNGAFRFGRLLAFMRRAGADTLATGHYARIVDYEGLRLLARAVDGEKDQSYMLAQLDPSKLDRIVFPLGDQTKAETRAEAQRAGLAVASRGESQEACFLAGDDYRAFLERRGLEAADGAILDEAGRELGRHSGHWRFTPGQRKGLGLAAPQPLYALSSDASTNSVVVGPLSALARTTVEADGRLYVPVERAEAKLRYRSIPVPSRVEATRSGFRLALDVPSYGVAPGQAAVLYDGDVVVGAGKIHRSA